MILTTLKNWYKRVSTNCNPLELEQALIRIMIGFLILLYIAANYYTHSVSDENINAFKILLGFETLSMLLFLAIVKNTFKPALRKVAGAWLDISATSIFIAFTADIGVMLVAVYLWVIFGNGFRFGKKHLYHAQLLSIIGFSLAAYNSSYWQGHMTIVQSILVILIALPLYVATLISRLNEATHKAELERQRADVANSAKTRFVANMSHEIRTPLNGIIGITTLFKTTPLNTDQKDLLHTLESSSKLLLSLLNNVLDFTKIEERKLSIENVPLSLEELITDTVELYHTQAQSKNIQLTGDVSSKVSNSVRPVKGDITVLRQVLANLMGNAIKFTEKGSVTLNASLIQDNIDLSTIRFEVADTGVGIPADKQHKVFESFSQADSSTTRKFGGSGLGLTIAKDMVEAMGGELKFQSSEGVGTRFWFDLKLEKDLSYSTTNNSTVNENVTPVSAVKPLDILICEDEVTNQKIITRLLSIPGHRVKVVDNSEAMLDTLETQNFDVVITDLNMAGMNGIEAIKLYRFTNPTDKATKFILFTADVTLETKEEANNAGFNGILTKPIDATTLFSSIENVLKLPANTAKSWLDKINNNSKPNNQIDNAAESTGNVTLDINTLSELEKLGAGDDLFMHRLLKNYLADSLKMLNNISEDIKQKHYGELRDHCHALKGNSLSVGALQLALKTDQLGKLTSSAPVEKSLQQLTDINNEFSKLTLEIEDYLRRPEAASK